VDDGKTLAAPAPERFAWLDSENRRLRRDLADLARAIRADQLRPDDRQVVVERLAALLAGGGLTDREGFRVRAILMSLADGPAEKVAALELSLASRRGRRNPPGQTG
jgi:hypothetical protein